MQHQNIHQRCHRHNEQLSLCLGVYRILSESPLRSIQIDLRHNKDTTLFCYQAICTVLLDMCNFPSRLLKNLGILYSREFIVK